MRFIQVAIEEIIKNYNGSLPLSHFLKQYFKQHPKLGARDRRAISDAVFSFYRLARFVPDAPHKIWEIIHWMLHHHHLNNVQIEKIVQLLAPPKLEIDLDVQIELTLSSGIEKKEWQESMLGLAQTFIRVRKNLSTIEATFAQNNIPYQLIGNNSIALANGIKLDQLLQARDYVIQDLASQKSLVPLINKLDKNKNYKVWDTCSGAGGKMLLLKDNLPKIDILCTDIRPSILHNLRERAKLYKHQQVQTMLLDSGNAQAIQSMKESFDIVLSDVPCSGSGTWARSPEQFYFFEAKKIANFAQLQFNIANNAIKKVKPGGYFVYITCSVFKDENETVLELLCSHNPTYKIVEQHLLNGIKDQSDSMFMAILSQA